MSRLKVAIHTRPYTTATYAPVERIADDTIEPLTIDEDDSKYLIVIIDCFSRYLKLHPAQDAQLQQQLRHFYSLYLPMVNHHRYLLTIAR